MKKMIDVKHLTKTYGTRFNQTKVLDNLSFPLIKGNLWGSWDQVVPERRH